MGGIFSKKILTINYLLENRIIFTVVLIFLLKKKYVERVENFFNFILQIEGKIGQLDKN